jgi:NAD(P)-dependent dehydrogenase (short-subunit alcohol dehydrogenase family)
MHPRIFSLAGRVAVVTGGYGVLGGQLALGLAVAGVKVAVVGRNRDTADAKVDEIRQHGGDAMAVTADVTDQAQVRGACAEVLAAWEKIDILVNAAGGNVSRSRSETTPIFDVPLDAFEEVLRLNLHGTVVPSMVVGAAMAARKSGVIVNISSLAATRAITHAMGYSIAKAGVENLTRSLAVDLARRYGPGIRVNAIAPGFFVANQNRSLLLKPDGTHTARGTQIIGGTPMGRFGEPHELVGAVQFLCSDAASFITGIVMPIDGGFSAFSGV